MIRVAELCGAIVDKTRPLDAVIAAVAVAQHGVIASWQLVALGLTRAAIAKRVQAGRLFPVFRGVYAVGHRALPPLGRISAAVLAYGPAAVASHLTAAYLHGLMDAGRSLIDVTAVAKRRSREGIRFHRARNLHPEDRDEIEGIPVTSLARTLLDIAEVVPQRKLVHAIERAEAQRRLDVVAVHAVIARNPRARGARRLREALAAVHPEAEHTRSALEREFLDFCDRYRLGTPAMNVAIGGFTVDAVFHERGLIVELDSWEHHKSRRAFEADRRRDALLRRRTGFEVLRVTYRWLTEDPDDLAAALSASPSRAATA